MKRAKVVALIFVSLFILVLAGCRETAPQPPTVPTDPVTPPTDPVTPPTDPVTPPPVDPVDPVDPVNPPPTGVPYEGVWGWVVVFEDETTANGLWEISQLESEPAVFTDSGEGFFVECEADTCPEEPTGLGVMGTLTLDDGSQNLATAFFVEGLSGPKLVALDSDNVLGTELEGQESFVGTGAWLNDDGTSADVAVGIVHVPAGASVAAAQNELEQLVKARKDGLKSVEPATLRELVD